MTTMLRKNLILHSLALLLLTAMCFNSVDAQEGRGLIIGQVTDAQGAVIPNATVTVTRDDTQQTYTAQTNSGGNFSLPYLQPGTYTVAVEASGFKKEERHGVTVDVAGKINLNIALEVGSVAETVLIETEGALLNTADASGGTVMDSERVQNLPLNGRQIYTLLDLTPGVKFTQTTFGPGGFSGTRGWDETNQYSINGVSGLYNQFTLNGAPITQQTSTNTGQWEVAPNVDAVHEFKIMSNTYDAQYGRAGGGTINTIIKNGTKDFHGTAFDFWRNDVLDANTFQLNARNTLRQRHNQHQFGGTFGGPIPKANNTFFFFSFEGWREILPNGFVSSTPANDVRPKPDGSVDFRQYFASQLPLCSGSVTTNCYNPNGTSPRGGIYDPLSCATTNADGTCRTRKRFSFNGQLDVIPPNRVSPIGLKILNLYPTANNPAAGEFANFTATNPGRYEYNQPLIRVDHKFSDKTNFYGMYLWWSGTEFRNNNGFDGPAMRGDINFRSNKTAVLDITHTFSQTLFADLRVSYNRTYKTTANGSVAAELSELTDQNLGLTMPVRQGIITTVTRNWAPTISVNGYETIIGNSVNQSVEALMYETYEFGPSFSKTMGRHSLHFGGQAMRLHAIPGFILGNPNGSFTFNQDFTRQNAGNQGSGANNDGAGLAALLLGYPTGGSVDFSYDVYEYYHYFAGYLQDDFKLRRNLTLNLGMRWDVELSPHERFNKLNAGFDYSAKSPISDLINFPNLPNGAKIVNPIKGGFKFSSDKLAPYDTQFNHWQPRIGVAWAINSKTVLRGGWGKFTAVARELGGNTTWTQNTPFTTGNPADGGNTPSGFFNTGIPYPNGVVLPVGNTLGLLSGVGNGQSFDQRDRKIPIIQQYSFGVQRELPGRMVLEVAYIGSNTRDLRVGTQMNHLPTEQMDFCAQPANWTPGTNTCPLLEQVVPNPFFWGNLNLTGLPPAFVASYKASPLGTPQNVRVKMLMTAFPHFWNSLFSNTEPVGSSNYNSLIVKLDKRISGGGALTKGLSLLTSFTYSRDMGATGFLNNSSPSSGSNGGGRLDAKPFYAVSASDRKFLLAFSGIWGLPVGRGGLFLKDAKGVLGHIINDWKLDWIFRHASGTPVGLPNGFNFNCPNHPSYLPDSGHKNYGQWLYNESPGCFTSIQGGTTGNPYAPITQVPRISTVRNPWAPQLALAMSKDFRVREGWTLRFKAEAFNVTNTPIFGGPSTANPNTPVTPRPDRAPAGQPGSCDGYGCVSNNQLNFPRQMQMSLKLIF
jgi:Carboxypeptidase regulatory-like domain/TonB-dependent Receptor Plug Domain